MLSLRFEPAEPVVLAGPAHERGLGQSRFGGATSEAVTRATVARVAKAKADGLIDTEAEAYLAAQRAFARECDPASMAELAGIAEGFGIAEEILFTHLHLGILRDRKQTPQKDLDGCSAWAVSAGPEGPLLVKNRDFSGTHLGVQRVFLHAGADIATGAILAVGSLGSPGAYSSGINAAGLALADTQVATNDHGVGLLRYFLMTRLLRECRTVDEAIAFVRRVVHAGGGTLILADVSGAAAAVELGHRAIAVERNEQVWRTNHFVSPQLSASTLGVDDDPIAANSRARFGLLESAIPSAEWPIAAACRLMASHAGNPGGGSLCQHGDCNQASTISSAVFACRAGTLYLAPGNPCAGDWRRYEAAA